MKLSKLSLLFSAALLLIVAINGSISLLVLNAFDRAQTVADQRVATLRVVEVLHQEMDALSRLVRTYVVTGQTRYLGYYHAILDIREGRKPVVEDGDPSTFWDRVIAGQTPFVPPVDGVRMSMRARMVAQGFHGAEIAALESVIAEAEALRAIEQVAFAATRGLYDPRTRTFVSKGVPHPELAIKMVFGEDYDRHRLRVVTAVATLIEQVDQRTSAEVAEARGRLRNWIVASIFSMAMTALLVLLAFRTTQNKVLQPIEDMCAVTGKLARGQYEVRLTGDDGVEEVQALRDTLNSMARAIETDIREREAIEQKLKDAGARAEQATQAKSMFLANMSHEIRTPLNAVIGMADLMLHSKLQPRQRDYAEKIRGAGRALLDILNDILDFSKIEAGRLELENIPFRLEQVVASAFLQVERAALEKGVELLFEARPESAAVLNDQLLGDPLRIGQVLSNLLSNAVKFTPAGHVALRVDGQEQEGRTVMLSITVEDTGIGMRADQINRLFDDFVQADGATTRRFGGTGLGLAIVRRLVDAMGGEIRVRSAPKRGSVFQALIPVRRDETCHAPSVAAAPTALSVLVADDYPEARLALIDLLNFEGIDEVDSVSSGAEVLECLESAHAAGRAYDLLFLDWSLPDRDGGAVLAALRARPELAPRHIALLSVPRSVDSDALGIHPDGLHFCDKPLLPGGLRRLCDEILGRSQTVLPGSAVDTGSLDGLRVLLVEDNATSRDVAIALMGRWGVEVDTAVDGRDALAQLAAQPADHYALVFMDLQMPVMDGYEAIRQIRAQPALAGLPVYALSAHSGRSVLERCLALGMNGSLNKPYELNDLHGVLARHHRGGGIPGGPPLLPPSGGAAVAGLDGIPGLDPQCAINDTGISPTLYPRLLSKFRKQFADGPQGLRIDVQERAWERVVPFAHTLKGRAGLLGMAEVSSIAGRLEAAANARDCARALAALQALELCLRPIVEGLGRILPADVEEDAATLPEPALQSGP